MAPKKDNVSAPSLSSEPAEFGSDKQKKTTVPSLLQAFSESGSGMQKKEDPHHQEPKNLAILGHLRLVNRLLCFDPPEEFLLRDFLIARVLGNKIKDAPVFYLENLIQNPVILSEFEGHNLLDQKNNIYYLTTGMIQYRFDDDIWIPMNASNDEIGIPIMEGLAYRRAFQYVRLSDQVNLSWIMKVYTPNQNL